MHKEWFTVVYEVLYVTAANGNSDNKFDRDSSGFGWNSK